MEIVYPKTGVGVGLASETGQTVVYSAMVSVVTCPMRAGQSVTVAAQLVMVYSVVA